MNPQQPQQQPYISFQDSLLGKALQSVGGQIWNLFQPQPIQSPIPTQDILAQRPQGFTSPVPQQQVLPNMTTPSPVQLTLNALGNLLPKGQTSQAQDMQPIKQAMNTLNPTPTPAPEWDKGFVMNTPDQYISPINTYGKQYNVPTNIISSLINQESHWNPTASSSAGAQGIAQFMPATAKGMGIDPYNTDQAIQGVARLLSSYKKRFGSWENALAAYNAGPGNVEKYKGIPPFTETQNYVKNILQNANHTFRRK